MSPSPPLRLVDEALFAVVALLAGMAAVLDINVDADVDRDECLEAIRGGVCFRGRGLGRTRSGVAVVVLVPLLLLLL